MKKILMVIVGIIAVGLIIWSQTGGNNDPSIMGAQSEEDNDVEFQYTGNLSDVSGGNATGTASAGFVGGKYMLVATFQNLPDPMEGYFYEGWVVLREPSMNVRSTGKVEKTAGIYTNTFDSNEDLTSHNFYVLTLEPDDGDPAPAKHIVEGEMKRIDPQ
jgi:hypothetical protein